MSSTEVMSVLNVHAHNNNNKSRPPASILRDESITRIHYSLYLSAQAPPLRRTEDRTARITPLMQPESGLSTSGI